MKRPTIRDILIYSGIAMLFCVFLRGWDSVVSFLGIVCTAIVPLLLGSAIAYVVSIPTCFLERHLLPNSTSAFVSGARRPVSLVINSVAVIVAVVLCSSMLAPALIETFSMVQKNGVSFVEGIIQLPIFESVRDMVHDFLEGDIVQDFQKLDASGIVRNLFGGTVGTVTTQLFTMVSSVMTFFFGMLFSFMLLTDNTNVGGRIKHVLSMYLGPERTEKLSLVCSVTDASFHNFIVRQFVEAIILGSVGMTVLLIAGFRYALGVGALMGIAALVPIVGYPIGLFLGAFMVAINNVWIALAYVACVALAQMFEATFVLPHVGDPRTVLPPVWVMVAVTIGGGVAGFLGMLLAIPVASSLRQLVLMDVKRRMDASATQEHKAQHIA